MGGNGIWVSVFVSRWVIKITCLERLALKAVTHIPLVKYSVRVTIFQGQRETYLLEICLQLVHLHFCFLGSKIKL